MDVMNKNIPYEEYRLVFDHVIHTMDGKAIRIGIPLQCNVRVSIASDKKHIVADVEELFNRMREAVIREME